ncbi:MAG: hypothetical protein GY797_26795 [Deltaproteobacteria bacterium]|nr:hypothetical protein [Deltaproteobacteria bacterium]
MVVKSIITPTMLAHTPTTVPTVKPSVTPTQVPSHTPTFTPTHIASSTFTPTPISTATSTPTVDLISLFDKPFTDWKVYTNTEYGFSFEYPAVYNLTADTFSCEITESEIIKNEQYFRLGHRYGIVIADMPQGLNLSDYVDQLVNESQGDDWVLGSRESVVVGNQEAIKIVYGSGSLMRPVTEILLEKNGKIYTLWRGGGFTPCGDEMTAYQRMVETLKFFVVD